MKKILSIFLLLAAVGSIACSKESKPAHDTPVAEPKVELSADRVTIVADGESAALFTVKVDGVPTTQGCKIVNVADYSELSGFSFTTMEAGNYTFVALYDNYASNETTIVATPVGEDPQINVELVADKKSIVADGADVVTFTVKVDGLAIDSGYSIVDTASDEALSGNNFTTTVAGSYDFQAIFGEFESNVVSITATPVGEEPAPTPDGEYKPGDLYDVDGVKGVVFYVNEDGKSGLIMSLDQADLQWSTEYVFVSCISGRGDYHTEDMLKLGADKYPAAKWCADHGEGWYMPSSAEMHKMWFAVSNETLAFDPEFITLYNDKLDDPILEDYYWTSNETNEELAEVIAFMADSVICLEPLKTQSFYVRAVYKF